MKPKVEFKIVIIRTNEYIAFFKNHVIKFLHDNRGMGDYKYTIQKHILKSIKSTKISTRYRSFCNLHEGKKISIQNIYLKAHIIER